MTHRSSTCSPASATPKSVSPPAYTSWSPQRYHDHTSEENSYDSVHHLRRNNTHLPLRPTHHRPTRTTHRHQHSARSTRHRLVLRKTPRTSLPPSTHGRWAGIFRRRLRATTRRTRHRPTVPHPRHPRSLGRSHLPP